MGLAKLFENIGIVVFAFFSIAFFCFIIIWQSGIEPDKTDAAGKAVLVASVVGLGLVINALLRKGDTTTDMPLKKDDTEEKE